jgi:hypothetical protein
MLAKLKERNKASQDAAESADERKVLYANQIESPTE